MATHSDLKSSPGVIVLAAGQGKRMKSSLPKVLHPVAGEPLLHLILLRIHEACPSSPVAIVVGHGREQVENSVRADSRFASMDVSFVVQSEQLGTGHAVRCAVESDWGKKHAVGQRSMLVLPGDLPLIRAGMVAELAQPLGRSAALRMLTCTLSDPAGYGRVIRRGTKGGVLRIVEERDANLREKAVREVATSIYSFQSGFLRAGLAKLKPSNAQKEYYLTDLIEMASRAKKGIDVLHWNEPEDLRGINDPCEWADAGRILNQRLVRAAAKAGVYFRAPESVWIDSQVEFEESAHVDPGVLLKGATRIGKGVRIGAHCVIENSVIGAFAVIKPGSMISDSRVGEGAQIGPSAHLRPGSEVGPEAKIGNFVELKKSKVGRKTSIAHLSYVGDAEVGASVNIGCGFVTCNYDGKSKHKTIIEDGAFVGSDCQAVAPLTIGRGAYIASGTTLTQDVEPDALAIARTRQVNKSGYAKKIRGESPKKES
jgi:bifunctional UDP-N-acetylglucosamine pyrophosphorylase/glucosamine-1-phosphate N-acetyltransferase